MTGRQLFLEGVAVDMGEDDVALTFQINNLAEVQNQQGNTSKQFKLPLTNHNKRVLGFPDSISLCGDLPYRQLAARLVQDGVEVVVNGFAEINNVENGDINITVLSGNTDFFDQLDASIYDMGDSTTITGKNLPWQNYDHIWNLENVAASQNKTDGWIWSIVDYGKIDQVDFTLPINVRYLRPGFFLKTAIEIMVANAGYKIDKTASCLYNNPLFADLYNKLIVQFANGNFEHGTDFQTIGDNHSIEVENTQQQAIDAGHSEDGSTQRIRFPNVVKDPGGAYDLGGVYKAAANVDVDITFNFDFQLVGTDKNKSSIKFVIRHGFTDGSPVVDESEINFDLSNNPQNFQGNSKLFTITSKKQSLTCSLTLLKNEEIVIAAIINKPKATFGYLAGGATFKVTTKEQNVLFEQKIQCERIFPDISQKDLLKDTLQRFAIICQTDNSTQTVTFSSLKDIIANIPIASDWTSKCLDMGKTVSFQLGGYAQMNRMLYRDDDNVLPKGFADSAINVDDKTLDLQADLIQSQFAATTNRDFIGGSIAQINKVDQTSDSDDFSVSTEPRILIDQKLNILALGKTVTLTDGTNSRVINDVISTPYFYKANGDFDLRFETLRLKYYPELEKVLKNSKKVIRYFMLTPYDIYKLNLLIPVYLQQDGANYYINMIDSWVSGHPTKVELVLLG